MHADLLRERGNFQSVDVAFLKEEPRLENVAAQLTCLPDEEVGNLTIVPDFLAEGYFTLQVIPSMLRMDTLPDSVRYISPVGTHAMMQDLIYQAAKDVLGDWCERDVTLLLVGHGSTKNPRSKETLMQHIEGLKTSSAYGQICDLWLEESPFVNEWRDVANHDKVLVVPFLLNDGQHGGWDIPEMLGLPEGDPVHGHTHELGGRHVRVAPALGTSHRFADVIEEVALLDRALRS